MRCRLKSGFRRALSSSAGISRLLAAGTVVVGASHQTAPGEVELRMVASWNADHHAVEEVRWPTRHFQFVDETTKTDLAMGFGCRLLEAMPRRDSPS
jgi:hypothetical protein